MPAFPSFTGEPAVCSEAQLLAGLNTSLQATGREPLSALPAIFAAEQRTIYGGRWVLVGRCDDIAEPGSFIVREVGGESIIVLRTEEGSAAAYYNVCRHRGARLLTAPEGVCQGVIRCPYHAWAYGLDGALRAAPNMPD